MKKYLILFLLIFCFTDQLFAQRGVQRITVDTLITTAFKLNYVSNRTAISNPIAGMIVRDSTASDSLFYYMGGAWKNLSAEISSIYLSMDSIYTRTIRIGQKLILGTSGTDTIATANKLRNDVSDTIKVLRTNEIIPKTDSSEVKAILLDSLLNSISITNKMLSSAHKDSMYNVDSTKIRTQKTTGNAYFTNAYKSSSATSDSEYVTKKYAESLVGGSVGNADSLGGIPASGYSLKTPGIITYVPAFPNRSFKILSADTSVGASIRFSGDSIVHYFSDTGTSVDSLRMIVLIPLPSDFSAFNTDSALTIKWWGSGNSTDSSYLEMDVYQYPLTSELDSVKLASNKAWNTILVKATSLTTNTWSDRNIMKLNFTIGCKLNHDIKIERIIFKYVRK